MKDPLIGVLKELSISILSSSSIGIMDKHFDWHYVKDFDWHYGQVLRLVLGFLDHLPCFSIALKMVCVWVLLKMFLKKMPCLRLPL